MSHLSWRTVWSVGKAYEKKCAEAIWKAGLPKLKWPVKISMEFFMARCRGDRAARPRDEDNAVILTKKLRDAFKVAGVLPDDSKRYMQLGQVSLYGESKQHKGLTGVLVTIEEFGQGDAI